MEQIKTSGIGMSRCVFTKKYHSDGEFDKCKCRIVLRGTSGMICTVRVMLSVVATEDM